MKTHISYKNTVSSICEGIQLEYTVHSQTLAQPVVWVYGEGLLDGSGILFVNSHFFSSEKITPYIFQGLRRK